MSECLGREPDGELNLGPAAVVNPTASEGGGEAMLKSVMGRWKVVGEEWRTREGRVKGDGEAHVAAFVRI